MREKIGKRELSVRSRRFRDRWLWAVSGLFIASFAGLVLADLLPASLEGIVVLVMLCLHGLYGAAVLGAFAWSGIAMLDWLYHAGLWFRIVALCLAACFVLIMIGALSAGLEIAGLVAAAGLQLLTPVVVVLGMRPRSPWLAMAFGAAMSLVSIVFYLFLYAVVFGIEGGYPFGDIGPGLHGVSDFVGLLCLCAVTVIPVIITMVAGAIGGGVGWGFARITGDGRALS